MFEELRPVVEESLKKGITNGIQEQFRSSYSAFAKALEQAIVGHQKEISGLVSEVLESLFNDPIERKKLLDEVRGQLAPKIVAVIGSDAQRAFDKIQRNQAIKERIIAAIFSKQE